MKKQPSNPIIDPALDAANKKIAQLMAENVMLNQRLQAVTTQRNNVAAQVLDLMAGQPQLSQPGK